ncbi:Hpt domain-containing protein [Hydrogenophaga sp.]|jgi:chemosensory pili system protein ChpA (sensor histidine kinase/response regulator)|uniref:hybrid sensor histidine kinase/response regulator n=1 Tax=Hydrogenophaga sp. TaxID=1904254 RepID=UPI002719CE0D|nr:Hpt domain-containing protein [Hydrogenophaga sp.]MDO9252421.1 Hpt domain-containing protein [Hydrogenophaga sp.]MDP3344246.1 Hpt domain-containing protein [Hydrogenophaga sp.]MDP3887261.1 Hpt domain-containing protein [Hydrogenophaga sp.]
MLDTTTDSLPMDAPLADLGPLAWVFDELRKSLDGANKAVKRFVRESEQSRHNDLEAVDPGSLRLARQQLHQAVGALEMVGLVPPAQVLRGMEAAVQRFVQRPQTCTEAAAAKVERAGFALIEYLQAVLNNKPVQPMALFPQYRDVQELAAAERVHPADLWPFERQANSVTPPEGAKALQPDPQLRSMFDRLVLLMIKTHSHAAAQQLARLSAGLSAGAAVPRVSTFWRVAAAYFEAVAHDLLPADVYVKRAASRILLQFAGLAQAGKPAEVSETLLRDLLFFCAQALPLDDVKTPHLSAVRQAFGLTDALPVDYAFASLGRFDPSVLAQARKRIGAAKESWALFSGGDANRARQVVDQYGLIGDSLLKLHPASTALAQVMVKAVDQAARGQAGVMRPELSMEVATTTLYLEAAFEDFDPSDEEFTERTQALAVRLENVLGGAPAEPLEAWMEQLYRRVSDRQTMGSVVGELKLSLGEAEKSLDQFFRMPREKACLHVAVSQLAQMRGVLSVLGLDQAVQAVSRMRTVVEQILDTEVDEVMAREAGTFQQLGDNLSALSFLVDMLNYQPALAKKLFVFDEETGELRPVMGRTVSPASSAMTDEVQAISVGVQRVVEGAQGDVSLADLSQQLDTLADQAQLAEQPGVARAAREAAQAVVNHDAQAGAQALVGLSQVVMPASAPEVVQQAQDNDDEDLLDIFLEEAREVVVNGLDAVHQLQAHPGELEQLTTLRRAFHTLKGSSRMVGLAEFGEAAWAMEQLFNAVLAEQRAAATGLLTLAHDAMGAFNRWVDAIEARADHEWNAQAFVRSAQAWRDQTLYLPLDVAGAGALTVPAEPEQEAAQAVTVVDWDQPDAFDEPPPGSAETSPGDIDFSLEPEPSTKGVEVLPMLSDIDFDSLSLVSSKVQVPHDAEEAMEPEERAGQTAMGVPSMFDDISLDLDDLSALDNAAPQAVETAAVSEGTGADATGAQEAPGQVDVDIFATPEAADVAIEVVDFEDVQLEQPEPDLAEDLADLALPEVTSEEATPAAPVTDQEPVSPETTPEEEPVANAPADDMPDDQTRLIGPLRIGIKLYNVYLNEADEWSRRLCTSLAEWSLERHEPVPDQAEALAHSLAGASATVGFQPLSDIARALEHALGAVALHQQGGVVATAEQSQLFVDAAEDIRRLLHQFAAGFFKEPNADLLAALDRLLHAPVPSMEGLDNEPLSGWDAELPQDAALGIESTVAPDDVASAFAPPDFEATGLVDSATVIAPMVEVESQGPVQDIDDDIDVLDTIDVDLFPIFADEALELLPRLGAALRQWVARPENTSARAEVLRNLHTLKGSARLAGALRLGEMAHRMETDAERLGSEVQNSVEVEPLLASFDAISARFELLRRIDPETQDVVTHAPEQAPTDALSEMPAPESVALPVAPAVESVDTGDMPGLTGLDLPSAPKAVIARAGAAVRVRPELLDRLVNQAGEVMITRSRMESELVALRGSLKDLTGNLDRLRLQLRDIELQAETQMQSRLAQARDADQSFDPLEFDRFTRVQELTRMMAESVNDVATVQRNLQRAVEATEDGLVAQGRQTRELQRDLLRTRMVEFEGISERLYRVVRQASKETGKQVRLDIVGGHIEMDRGVLDRMTAAFEHLLRNCVVHGIEPPEVRLAAGKAAEGRIEVRLAHELNDVSLVFQDDGAGLDLARLREKALAMGHVVAGTELSDEEAAQLVFMPGLTTASEVSSLAGRGVGMDVVRTDVVALGGRVETRTRPGHGTDFKLVLPLTTAVTQVVMVRAGSLTLGVPSNLVELVRRVSADELAQAYAKGTLTVGGEEVPFYWAGALLQSSARSQEAKGRTLPVVIFRSAAQRVAMHVDEVLGNQEVVVKNLGPQLSRLPGLAGMSVLASGAVALIYNPVALATVYGPQVREWVSTQTQQPVQTGAEMPLPMDMATSAVPLVLVVDDSITVRRVTQRLLQREGYRVSLAADGLQALERLQQERPTVVLSDIEMPRMDGFDLVRNIRSDPRLAALPVIMITSRIAEKHREHARELGVDHYLGKPYAEDELLALVAHYTKIAAEA